MKSMIEEKSKEIQEASNTYTGRFILMDKKEAAAFFLALSLGNTKVGVESGKSGVFVKDADLKKIDPSARAGFKGRSVAGAFDFAIGRFFKGGIRGAV